MNIEENLKGYSLKIAEAIFSNQKEVEIEGEMFPIKIFKNKQLRYVDLYGFRFIEQNPAKSSRWGEMARKGAKIIWVFRGRTYYARVIDGKFTQLKK
ncbi:MAG: hypothetical protein ACTSRS_19600 [Candidatus Helarchaeota archaeon]